MQVRSRWRTLCLVVLLCRLFYCYVSAKKRFNLPIPSQVEWRTVKTLKIGEELEQRLDITALIVINCSVTISLLRQIELLMQPGIMWQFSVGQFIEKDRRVIGAKIIG